MEHITHNAIIVVSWKRSRVLRAALKARELGCEIIGPSLPALNGYTTLVVCPDGSKSGWDDDMKGDIRRAAFRAWLTKQTCGDGSAKYEWCEVEFGNDDESANVVASPWKVPEPANLRGSS